MLNRKQEENTHILAVLKIHVNIPLKKNIYIMFLFDLHTNTRIFSLHCCLIPYTRIFSLHTAVSSCIHAFFLYLYFYILNTRIFSLCWSPILPRRYFVSKKKNLLFSLKSTIFNAKLKLGTF